MFKDRIQKAEADWGAASGRHRTSREFAEYLGVKEWDLAKWKTGTMPKMESLRKIARVLGEQVYEWAELRPRDVLAQKLLGAYEAMDERQQIELVRRAVEEAEKGDDRRNKRKKSGSGSGNNETHAHAKDPASGSRLPDPA